MPYLPSSRPLAALLISLALGAWAAPLAAQDAPLAPESASGDVPSDPSVAPEDVAEASADEASASGAVPYVTNPQATEPPADETTPDPGARVEFSDGLRVTSGEHSVVFRLLGEVRYVNTHDDGQHTSGFQLSLLRPSVRGRFFDGLVGVFVQTELAGANARVLDAEVTLTLDDAFIVTAGQFITPASRAFMTPIPVLLFPDFSIASVAFREGRDVGGMVRGSFLRGRLAYYTALVNGNGINVPGNNNAGLTLVTRLEAMPLGNVRFDNTQTLGGHSETRFSVAATSYVDLLSHGDAVVGGDAMLVAGPVMVLTEAYAGWLQLRTVQRRGAYAQIGVTVVPDRLQLGFRASVLDPDIDMPDNAVRVLEGLVSIYALGNRAKVMLRYAFSDVGSASMATQPAHNFVVQMQGWL